MRLRGESATDGAAALDADPCRFVARKPVTVGAGVEFGGEKIVVIAGPCSVESAPMIDECGRALCQMGVRVLRGGVVKPRTSPHSFQGLGVGAVRFLAHAGRAAGLPVVTEVLDPRDVEEMSPFVDMFQVGARNMYNYPLLKELSLTNKPVLLKRSFTATIDEFLGAAEYLVQGGNDKIVLCERGIRSFDTSTRFLLDLSAIPVLRERSEFPIVVDPTHGTGVARYVESMACAAIAAGADGIMVEAHPDPSLSVSDGFQTIPLSSIPSLMQRLRAVAHAVNRSL